MRIVVVTRPHTGLLVADTSLLKSWFEGPPRITKFLLGTWKRTALTVLTAWSLGALARWHFILSEPHTLVEQFAQNDSEVLATLGGPIEISNPFDPGRATSQISDTAEYSGNYASVRLNLHGREHDALLDAFIKEVPGGWKPVQIMLIIANGDRVAIHSDQIMRPIARP